MIIIRKESGEYHPSLVTGLERMGLSRSESHGLEVCLRGAAIPNAILDVVIENLDRVSRVHPDDYPWQPTDLRWVPPADDELCAGLRKSGVDLQAVWDKAAAHVREKYGRGMPAQCDIKQGADEALTTLISLYALIQYHPGLLPKK
jgi:hypothetical protein